MKPYLFLPLILLTAACNKDDPEPKYVYLPNLHITKFTYENQRGSTYINDGDTLFVTVEIKNYGGEIKDYFNVSCKAINNNYTIKNVNYNFVPYILAENNQIVSLHFVVEHIEKGNLRIIIDADNTNYIPESNEEDNVLIKDIIVEPFDPIDEEIEQVFFAINN